MCGVYWTVKGCVGARAWKFLGDMGWCWSGDVMAWVFGLGVLFLQDCNDGVEQGMSVCAIDDEMYACGRYDGITLGDRSMKSMQLDHLTLELARNFVI
ncbi:hypothetical protein VFPPC_15737 [Pochonia chlamydosporia 170]|uniref:Uncharacterized protein n=1 Tax=Pochonia chlamydosporia 170 TaxID=1380566 RepID=A0A179FQD8_METCM|nr:hypothetical protein VFPPC_15737 [Pochonia chlamydosporia 170]OAQ67836.1 hypothetical protein VFPPC_15737 [Pochonia chlamydosporia 170]